MEHVREYVRASQGFKDIQNREGGSFSPDKSGTRSRTCSCFPRIKDIQNREGVVLVPIKMEHVRERVRASQGFTFTAQTPGMRCDLCPISSKENEEEKE